MAKEKIATQDLGELVQASAVADADNLVSAPQIMTAPAEEIVLAGTVDKTYEAQLSFNEELVEIVVDESSDPHAENPVPVGVNGQYVYFKRGEATTCKRKFVEALCARNVNIRTEETRNNLGEMGTNIRSTSAIRYPFTMLNDPNPKGREWLRNLVVRGY